MHISERLRALKPSATVAFTQKAKDLLNTGKDVVVLAAGEPDFTPPEHIREAVAREAMEGPTCYGNAAGSPQVREALVEYLARTKDVHVSASQLVLSSGAKHCLFNALSALLDPGDEVIVLAPYWVTYIALIELMGGIPRVVTSESVNGFKVTPDQIRKELEKPARCIIFNNPCNPSGAYYNPDEVREITEACVDAGCAIVSDEVYDMIVFEDTPYLSPFGVSDEAADITALVGGFSKTYAMTGWRLGFAAMNRQLVDYMTKLTINSFSCTPMFTQLAGIEALTGPQDEVNQMMEAYKRRRDLLVAGLNELEGFHCVLPAGAFYAFPNHKSLGIPSAKLAELFLQEAGVACLPGSAFGEHGEGYLRFTYASSEENISRALERLAQALKKL